MHECEFCGRELHEETDMCCSECGEPFLCVECADDEGPSMCEICLQGKDSEGKDSEEEEEDDYDEDLEAYMYDEDDDNYRFDEEDEY